MKILLKKIDVVYYNVNKEKWVEAKKFYSEILSLKQTFGSDEIGWIEYRVKDDHTTALGISLVSDDQPISHGGATVVFIVDNLTEVIDKLKNKGVEFIGDVYSDEMLKLIKFKDPSGNILQLVEVLN